MEDYMKKGIKDLIALHPVIGSVLKAYGIDCAGCSVGICALEDVVKMHRLPENTEKEMMDKITMIFTSGAGNPAINEIQDTSIKDKLFTYSNPMKRLVDEHRLINRWLALIPEVIRTLDLESEEGVLFSYFDENSDILNVMKQDHAAARRHAAAVVMGVEQKNADAVKSHLMAYKNLLQGHIQKEDEILFPWIDSVLSTDRLGEISVKFNRIDETIGFSPDKYERFINQLEKDIKKNGSPVSDL